MSVSIIVMLITLLHIITLLMKMESYPKVEYIITHDYTA